MFRLLMIAVLIGTAFAVNGAKISAVEQFDLVITNARIVDGTGNPWIHGSIAVKDGKIVEIGRVSTTNAAQVIDAQNKIVAPGFIDVHAHVEGIYNNPAAENFVRMGVTSLITGNCGGSAISPAEFLGRIKEKPIAVNLGTLIAHGTVREKVLGLNDRAPSDAEQAEMNRLVDQAMREGAVGLSTGLIYLPGTFAKTEEVVELAKAAAKHGGVYASHIRNEGNEVVEAINEAISVGEQANLPVEISHFKVSSKKLWGQSTTTIGLVNAARARGQQVTVDQYAYTASSTGLDARLPNWVIEGGREETRKRLDDPATRKRIADEMKKKLKESGYKDYSYAYVAEYRPDPTFNGQNIAEITKRVRGSKKVDAQLEQIFEMVKTGRVSMVYRMMSEEDVQNIMRQPFTMIASDSSVRDFGSGVPHPRGYGNNARVLGRYVREQNVVSLEDAIRKMTSLPAQTFNLEGRGLLRKGYAADIVIFDEKTVGDTATFEEPHQYAKGFSAVIVNGKLAFDGTAMTGVMPGEAIRGPGFSKP